MNLNEKFKELKQKKQGAFMAHLYYGDPNENFSIELIKTLIENGVDILEFGIPFSDPTADGSTFIRACERSLKNNMTPKICIEGIKKIRASGYNIPIIVTSYFNIIYQYGIEKFIKDIKEAGAQGLIIPEAVVEESDELQKYGGLYDIKIIYLIGPNSSDIRIDKILEKASGFLYLVAKSGVTGTRNKINNPTYNLIGKVKTKSKLPALVGFGISKPEQIKPLMQNNADGIIIGSAIAKIYERYIINNELVEKKKCLIEVKEFIKNIKDECKY